MSGHSKWATTKHRKAAVDAKRANIFTKLARNIVIAARRGADPDFNFSLRLAIDKAKAENMPKDKIEQAIKRGTGELEGAVIEEVLYEGFGPAGIALIIVGATDNKNRTMSEIKTLLSKNGGTLSGQNAVKWMFDHKGVIHLTPEQTPDKDAMTLELIDMGADDVQEEDGGLTLFCQFEKFEKIRKALESKGLKLEYAEMEWVAKEKTAVDEKAQEKIQALVEQLEGHDDINSVFTNVA